MSEGNLFINDHQHHDGEPTFVNDIEPEYITCRFEGQAEVIVWQRKAEAGDVEFTTPGAHTWVVPTGVRDVKLCMIGGGGCGNNNTCLEDFDNSNGGGYAGTIISKDLTLTPGDTIDIFIGTGGQRKVNESGTDYPAEAGTNSTFDTHTATGGAGGNRTKNPVSGQAPSPGYGGNGALKTHCRGSNKDGLRWIQDGFNNTYWGGEAGLGDGGGGGVTKPGAFGSGSSGGLANTTTGHGGNGAVFVSWE